MTTTHIGGLVLLRTGHFGLELGYLGLNIRHGDTLPNNIQNDCVAEMRMARQQIDNNDKPNQRDVCRPENCRSTVVVVLRLGRVWWLWL